jgi:hypothetical protein
MKKPVTHLRKDWHNGRQESLARRRKQMNENPQQLQPKKETTAQSSTPQDPSKRVF